jgi:hypothetical protein
MEAHIMRKNRLAALFLAAALALTAAVGCSGNREHSSSTNESSYKISEDGRLDGLADKEYKVGISEEADVNETLFKLNKVIDSGKTTDSGEHYVYLDVTIHNSTEKEYELSMLNNFFILFGDTTEAHYDIRTQLYAAKNLDGYQGSDFTVPAKGSFSGVVGGFLVPSAQNEYTVCFFPSLDDERDKSNVIKVKVDQSNISKLTPAA